MPVKPEEIEIDKCYVTRAGQVRHVLSISDGKVVYESRGKKYKPFPWIPSVTVNIDKFADDVERQDDCDYDPDYPKYKPDSLK